MKTKSSINVNRSWHKRWFSLSRMTAITYLCVVLAIILTGTKFWLFSNRYAALFNHSTYQAITLTNGQTFFGKLDKYGLQTYVLYDVYYLKQSMSETEPSKDVLNNVNADTTSDSANADNSNINSNITSNTNINTNNNTESTESQQNNLTATNSDLKLVRLVDDFQEPNNYLIINREQIVFWQNLADSSPIMKTIVEFQQQQ